MISVAYKTPRLANVKHSLKLGLPTPFIVFFQTYYATEVQVTPDLIADLFSELCHSGCLPGVLSHGSDPPPLDWSAVWMAVRSTMESYSQSSSSSHGSGEDDAPWDIFWDIVPRYLFEAKVHKKFITFLTKAWNQALSEIRGVRGTQAKVEAFVQKWISESLQRLDQSTGNIKEHLTVKQSTNLFGELFHCGCLPMILSCRVGVPPRDWRPVRKLVGETYAELHYSEHEDTGKSYPNCSNSISLIQARGDKEIHVSVSGNGDFTCTLSCKRVRDRSHEREKSRDPKKRLTRPY